MLPLLLACSDKGPADRPPGTDDPAATPPTDPAPASGVLAALVVRANYADPSGRPPLDQPESLEGFLQLEVADTVASGVLGLRRTGDPAPYPLVEVRGALADGSLRLDPVEVRVPAQASYAIADLTLALSDLDADGVLDVGAGTSDGRWTAVVGDQLEQVDLHGEVGAAAYALGGTLALVQPASRAAGETLPTDPLAVAASQPVLEADWLGAVGITADGEPLAGTFEGQAVAGWLTLATFAPAAPVPFGAEVAVEPGGVTTAAGTPVLAGGELTVPPDPGSLLDNPGFEAGLSGWLASGAAAVGPFCDLAPAEGSAQAAVRSGESLLGVLEVPADADALVLRAAAFSEIGEYDPDRSAVVALVSDDDVRTVIWDADALEDAGESVACAEGYGHRVGPEEVRVDLAPHRGRTVFLVGSARGSSFFGVNDFALLLDDVRIE